MDDVRKKWKLKKDYKVDEAKKKIILQKDKEGGIDRINGIRNKSDEIKKNHQNGRSWRQK